MKPPAKKAASEISTLDDILLVMQLLPDDPAAETAQLAAAIMADLAPKAAFEKIIASNLVDVEIERQRLKRWIRALTRDATWLRIRSGFRSKSVPESAIAVVAAAWDRGDGPALAAAVQEHGIDISHAVVHARVDIADKIKSFESDLRHCENRRRLLFRDLKLMRDDRRPAIADADLVE